MKAKLAKLSMTEINMIKGHYLLYPHMNFLKNLFQFKYYKITIFIFGFFRQKKEKEVK